LSAAFDLGQYAEEVGAFAELAESFVDATSALRLSEVARELQGFVAAGNPVIDWQTRQNIVFRHSNLYDGPGKHHRDTSLELGFECRFERPARTKKKCKVWNIGRVATHLTLKKEERRLSCHFDYKNAGQWGPQIHFQVKETEENGFLPIPRIASLSFLPTDCADLGLAELHPEAWRKLQSSGAMSHHTAIVRAAQEQRSLVYLADIAKQWNDDKKATRICMLQDYTSNVRSLPDRHGREARL